MREVISVRKGAFKVRSLLFCSLLVFLFLRFPVRAASIDIKDYKYLKTNAITLYYPAALQGAAEEITKTYPLVKAKLEGLLSQVSAIQPVIILVKKHDDFVTLTGNGPIVAYAQPRLNRIVIDYSQMRSRVMLEETLRHETAHLMLFEITGRRLPRWFDEGVSQWLGGGLSELIEGSGGAELLKKAVISEQVIPLSSLEVFPSDRRILLLAYEESKGFIEFIIKRYGKKKLISLLEHLRYEDNFDVAFNDIYLSGLRGIEQEWLKDLKKRATVFNYLSQHLYEIVFFVAALITFSGFIRMIIKKRRYRDEEFEDDEDGYDERYPWE